VKASSRSKVKRLSSLFISLFFFLIEPLLPSASADFSQSLSEKRLAPLEEIVKKAIRAGQIPGAVVLVGNRGKIVYRRAFGHRAIKPKKIPMTVDTLFDIASLTKGVATATAVMQLVENGKLDLDETVAKYWPEFKANGKEQITVRHLLTHYSGLRPGLTLKPEWTGCETALKMIIEEKLTSPPGTRFVYSDINFQVLGELVERISGQPLDQYCQDHIFTPLGMKDTCFRPSASLYGRIAPTRSDGVGEVHDPTAYRMGGIAGHAGLFSTADDLSIFAQMLLDEGRAQDVQILSAIMVEKMTLPQSPPGKMPIRGLGWDIDSPFASNRDELLPMGSYGHKGFTGTGIWIDPVSKTYLIILTNRVHPEGKGDAGPLRAQILSLVGDAIGPVSMEQVLSGRPSLRDDYDRSKSDNGKVQSGIDVLVAQKIKPLAGLRLGLITNHSGIDSTGRRTLDLLHRAQTVKLRAIFSPEHGLSGEEDRKISGSREPLTGLPVYSLYGEVKKPTQKMLDGLDALAFDIQDAGTRFYTYITTMGCAMEAAAKKRIPFYILDRPNPVTGVLVQGPIMDRDLKSFTGYFPLPIRHGMTVGELAAMFNGENKIGANLKVIKMSGYRRGYWYDETGLPWINPSPNLRTLTQAILYPGVAMVEAANVSVGRGTDTPFELLGAPWVDAPQLTEYLNRRKIDGIKFKEVNFTPEKSPFKNQVCHGVRIVLTDRQALDSTLLGVEIVSALRHLYPDHFQIDKTLSLIGSRQVLQAIKGGQDPLSVVLGWQGPLEAFQRLRSKYLLY
jgi:uncharacterized protein YbbC (DUF1343 family)/CubicO group peptidase (beta-lactamase class C family)